jgi:hypothetical protein
MKKAGASAGFTKRYSRCYLPEVSPDLDSFGEAGVEPVAVLGLDELPIPELELELAPALPDMPLPVEPLAVALESAPGAGVGMGAVADEEGAGALAAGAGAGVTTFSSFLQAVRPIAIIAAIRSERFMIFPLGERHRS